MMKEAHPDWGQDRIHDMLIRTEGLEASAGAVQRVLLEAGYEVEQAATRPHPPQAPRLSLRHHPCMLDNEPEFTAQAVREWPARVGVKTLFIEPGSPWENGYVESFNSKLRDEFLNGELFYTLEEARVLLEMWRREYNEVRPHSALGYRAPAPVAHLLAEAGSATLRRPRTSLFRSEGLT
jgi:hypothetical protein